MKKLLIFGFILSSSVVFSQAHSHAYGRKIIFPAISGYQTLKCDLHQHTVFSDGSVWPDIRVMEALQDGLDVISLTEHLEYQPHKADIPHPDRNRSYEIAIREAKNHDLLVVKGSEITRRMPPGHCNAVVIEDPNKLLISDSIGVFREARRQNGFVFWNHPNWTSQRKDAIATLTDMHRFLIKENLLHGIEVVNDQTYSEEALQIALDNNLTIMGTSDIHRLIDWDFKIPEGGHRPLTLVFAKEKTAEGVRDALMDRRTVVYYKDMLIGRDTYLMPLIQQSLLVKSASYQGNTNVLRLVIENKSSCKFTLQNNTSYTFHSDHDIFTVEPGSEKILEVKTIERLKDLKLDMTILNAVNAPGKHPAISLRTDIGQ